MDSFPSLHSLEKLRRFQSAFVLLLSLALTIVIEAKTIKGTVADQQTQAYLEGVRVTLNELDRTVLTDREGRYQFIDVPAGQYTVKTYYTGMDDNTSHVNLDTPIETAEVRITLTSSIHQLEKFVVSVSEAGEAASLTKQRNAANVVNVVSTDAFGSVADGNIGNFMVRLAGVAGDYANGEVTGIKIRGSPAELSALNVDGVRAANANFDNPFGDRGAQIDTIPAEFIKEVEITKAARPDQPADSIGGSANLITKSALDYKTDVLTYRVGANLNLFREDLRNPTPNAALTYLTQVGRERQLGVTLSLSYSDTESPRDRVQMTRVQPDGRNTQARTLTNVNSRQRAGAGLKFDYRLSPTTSVFLKLNYNYYDFTSPREVLQMVGSSRVADYARVSRAQIEAGVTPRDNTNAVAGTAPGYTDTFTEMLKPTFLHSATNNLRTGRQFVTEVGGKKILPDEQEVSFQASYNPSGFTGTLHSFDLNYVGPSFGLSIDTSEDLSRPKFRQTFGPNVGFGSDFGLYTGRLVLTHQKVIDDISNAKIDWQKKFSRLPLPFQMKAGLNWRQQFHSSKTYTPAWAYVGSDKVAGLNSATGLNDDNLGRFRTSEPTYTVFNSSGVWPKMDGLNYFAAYEEFLKHPELYTAEASVAAAPVYRSSTEDVYAAYAMSQTQFRRINLLAGVRIEQTRIEAQGTNNDPRNPTVTKVARRGSYQDYFPSVHLRYTLRRNLLARVSYSTGAGRPNYSDLYPSKTVTYNTTTGLGAVSQNDPGLLPQYAESYDLSLEYYFEPAGVVSVGVFRKDITDFIARNSQEIGSGADNGFDGQYAGFTLNTTTNLGSAKIEGVELNYSQRFTMLPRPFDGLGAFGNYTRLQTEGSYSLGVSELVNFVPTTINLGLSYRWRKWEVRAAYNYSDTTLISYNENLYAQQRTKPLETINLNFKYAFRQRFEVFLDVINLKNKWPEVYTGLDPSRITISDSYGTRINFGISGRF